MSSIDPPTGPGPDRCAGWPLDRGCGKYDKAHNYDIWERKRGLQFVEDLGAWLCRPCYRAYKKRQNQQIIPKSEESNKSK